MQKLSYENTQKRKFQKGGDLNGQHEHRVQNQKADSARVLALTTPDGLQR